ncbi:MAG: hypothetical protein ACUVUG_04530, partial [Candidatus Aminicenantia bacterium]
MRLKRFLITGIVIMMGIGIYLNGEEKKGKFKRFSIKFSGGTGYLLTCGDIKEYLQNEEKYFSWLGTNPNYSVSSDF